MTSQASLRSVDDATMASGTNEEGQTGVIGTPNDDTAQNGHKRTPSGGLSKLSFLRASAEDNQLQADHGPPSPEPVPGNQPTSPKKTSRAKAVAVQQQKTRQRKGSLRKAALLGRGIQREKRDLETSPLITNATIGPGADGTPSPVSLEESNHNSVYALGILDNSSYSSVDSYSSSGERSAFRAVPILAPRPLNPEAPNIKTSPTLSYTSTTDEDDVLSFPKHQLLPPVNAIPHEDYLPAEGAGALFRRRSTKKPNSPLSLGGLAATSLPASDDDWDYAETEWWGWVVLIVTWVVFVVGMGSCLGVWSWAWDVGETPYAPPELEDDPTLPIVGYYPALIILTAVMAWVWVVVAWVGMKYFRHAKISGD